MFAIVEEYVTAAMRRAVVEQFDDGTLVATVSGLPGIVAGGVDVHACAEELYRRLGQWVMVSLASGNHLPIIDDISLNTDANRTRATYHQSRLETAQAGHRRFFENDEQFDAALDEIEQSPCA